MKKGLCSLSFDGRLQCIELFRSKKFHWVRWKALFDVVQFYLMSDSDFRGPVTNRFIMIYCKRDEDGTKRKLIINLPKLANPGYPAGAPSLENRDSLKQTKTRKCFPIYLHIDIERAFLAWWALFTPSKVTGLWTWTFKEINYWLFFRVRVRPLDWQISRDWLILKSSLLLAFILLVGIDLKP